MSQLATVHARTKLLSDGVKSEVAVAFPHPSWSGQRVQPSDKSHTRDKSHWSALRIGMVNRKPKLSNATCESTWRRFSRCLGNQG